MSHDLSVQMALGKTMSSVGCFVGVAETIFGRLLCFVILLFYVII